MTDPYRALHEKTITYDILKDTTNALQGRYIALARAAIGDANAQRAWKQQMVDLRDAVAAVDPDDQKAITELTNTCRQRIRNLEGTG